MLDLSPPPEESACRESPPLTTSPQARTARPTGGGAQRWTSRDRQWPKNPAALLQHFCYMPPPGTTPPERGPTE
ncbi:MAG: hypothetical protein WBL87_01600 [Methanothrix sp.]